MADRKRLGQLERQAGGDQIDHSAEITLVLEEGKGPQGGLPTEAPPQAGRALQPERVDHHSQGHRP